MAGAAGGPVWVPLLRTVLPGLLRGVPVLQLRPGVRAGAGGVRRVQGLPDLQRRGPHGGVHRHVIFSGVCLSSNTGSAQWLYVYYWSSHLVALRGLNWIFNEFCTEWDEFGMAMFN